jgi:hypothetical protein
MALRPTLTDGLPLSWTAENQATRQILIAGRREMLDKPLLKIGDYAKVTAL